MSDEEGFASAFRYASIGMALVSPEGRFLKVNEALCRLTGYSEAELFERTFQDITHPEDLEADLGKLRQLLAGEIPSYQMEKRYFHKEGHLVWILLSVSLVCDAQGRPSHAISQIQDITDRKLAVEELERLRNQHEGVLSAVSDGVHWIGLDGLIRFENPAGLKMLGYEKSELIGQPAYGTMQRDASGSALAAPHESAIQATLKDGRIRHVKNEVFWRKDGTRFDVEYTATPTRDEKGRINGAVVTFADVTERRKVELEMRHARLAAEGANRAKTEFLANMSHEIRTPLNGIIGMTDLLRGIELTAEQGDFLETIHASGENLLTIVNDVLDFSKIEFGKLELDDHPFSLLDLIDDVAGLLNFRLTRKKLDFHSSIHHELPVDYLGDANRIRQVLINLVSNAIKFTDEGKIGLEIGPGAPQANDKPGIQRVLFRVQDSGIGIPADRLDRLFKIFSQVDASTTRRYGGSGLGLAICQKLVEVMGGAVHVESEPGRGSLFSFELPLRLAPRTLEETSQLSGLEDRRILLVDPAEISRRMLAMQLARGGMRVTEVASREEAVTLLRRGETFDAALVDLPLLDSTGASLALEMGRASCARALPLVLLSSSLEDMGRKELREAGFAAVVTKPVRQGILRATLRAVLGDSISSTPAPAPPPASGLQILVVEDNATNQKVARQILKRLGHDADLAANGFEAIQAVEKKIYHLILMDIHMPEMDGLEATRRIRAMSSTRGSPRILALTADVLKGERETCLSAGMDGYLTKPIRIDILKEVIEGVQANTAPPS